MQEGSVITAATQCQSCYLYGLKVTHNTYTPRICLQRSHGRFISRTVRRAEPDIVVVLATVKPSGLIDWLVLSWNHVVKWELRWEELALIVCECDN